MGILKSLFGGSSQQPEAPPPMAMPPTIANPLLWALSGKRSQGNKTATTQPPLVKGTGTTMTSLLGG